MLELLAHLRVLEFYAEHAHNVTKGPLFFGDHCFLGEIYEASQKDYDAVAERMVLLQGIESLDQLLIVKTMYKALKSLPMQADSKTFFSVILDLEKKTSSLIELLLSQGASEGTKQLLGEMCNQGEMRCYKISQRIK